MDRIKRAFSRPEISLFVAVLAQFILLPIIHIHFSQRYDLPRIIGDRCDAILDMWSLQHLCSGMLIGSIIIGIRLVEKDKMLLRFILMVIALELCWEAAELLMEAGYFGHTVSNWKQGYEHWGNRFIGDPFMTVLGGLLARKFSSLWKIALIITLIWMTVNIAAPNSMYIQRFVFGS